MARSKKILEGSVKELKRRASAGLLRMSAKATVAEIGGLAGVASAKALNGEYVVALQGGVDQRDFLRRALERYEIESFSRKEPVLEEIFIDAVRSAGLEETRTIE
jgi:ABC-2 type transport system ATP-binding protein